MPKFTLFLLLALCFMQGCDKSTTDDTLLLQDTYRDYYPIHTGMEMRYRIDSILPSAFGVRLDTTTSYLKDVVGAMTIEGQDTVYVINRYSSRQLTTNAWNYQYSYAARLRPHTLEVTEKEWVNENGAVPLSGLVDLKFIKLSDPINQNTSWDGNRYFTLGNAGNASYLYKYNGWKYAYTNLDETAQLSTGTLPNCITVLANDALSGDTNLQNPQNYQLRIYAKEMYAKHIGLVYKHFVYTDHQPPNSISPGYQAKSFGIIMSRIL